MIFEFYPPEMQNIRISCQGTTVYIHKQVQKDFSNYSKLLVQINNGSKDTPDYIYLNMYGSATATPVKAHLVVYGVKDWQDTINPEVYDYDHNNHGMRIVKYTNKIVSTIAWLTDGPWQDLPNYYVNFNQPTVDNVVKLITYLQVSNDQNGDNLWCRWVVYIINPVTKNKEKTHIIQVNTTNSFFFRKKIPVRFWYSAGSRL